MSSFRRSHHRGPIIYDHDIRFENRNSEEVHRDALAAAYAEHQKIYDTAVRVNQLEQARLEQLRLQEQNIQEEERVRLEEERVREQIRLQELQDRARQIPKVPARAPTPPPPAQPPVQETKSNAPPSTQTAPAVAEPTFAQPPPPVTQPTPTPINPFQTATPAQAPTTQSFNQFAQTDQPASTPFAPASQPATAPSQPTSQPAATTQQQSTPAQSVQHLLHGVDRYVEIHRSLKDLRKYVNSAGDANKEFKKAAGELRRTLRMAIGQCVADKSKNKGPVTKIFGVLQQSLTSVPSPGVDPSMYMLSKPNPSEKAMHNGEQLPALFIYLLNYFAKYVVSQFVNEAGVNPELADPVGVVVVQVFSRTEFLWRGETMIDILMAKVRVTCPVLFGVRGNEATEEGRARLGWIRDESGSFISEQIHGTRMVGMAAGYAALCLRDFSKSKLKNPWHPTHYWQTMASIVATPTSQRSTTQYVVLRSMIDGYEGTFLKFYGNAARAALTAALVTFPKEAVAKDSTVPLSSSAVGGVQVLADKLARDRGIILRA